MKKRRKILLCQEFMLATDMTASGSPEEKLRWAFKMYDKDGSGALTFNSGAESKFSLEYMKRMGRDFRCSNIVDYSWTSIFF